MGAEQAIVIGGGMAGLLAAKVLAERFERVTVIERDQLPETAEYRKGVPQARHVHILLKGGEIILEQFFPGLVEELKAAGALSMNAGSEVDWYIGGIRRVVYESDLNSLACSRPLLETTIRRRVMADPKISFRQEAEVTGLQTDPSGQKATGVRLRQRDGQQTETILFGDLIVEASGRESHGPEWLETLGFPVPQETVVDAFGGYASRIYEWPAGFTDWKMLYVQPTPNHCPRGGIIVPLEGNRMHLTLIGMDENYVPTDEAGFLEFARSLPVPVLYDTIKQAKPLSPITGFRKNFSRLRYYDQLPRYLENFVLTGDSVLAFNPIYGQGMTVAAMSANCLKQCLTELGSDLTGLAEQFQKKQLGVIAVPWQLILSLDSQWTMTQIKGIMPNSDPSAAQVQNYMKQVGRISLRNPVVAEAMSRVRHMVEPPSSLFHPAVVMQVVAELATTP